MQSFIDRIGEEYKYNNEDIYTREVMSKKGLRTKDIQLTTFCYTK